MNTLAYAFKFKFCLVIAIHDKSRFNCLLFSLLCLCSLAFSFPLSLVLASLFLSLYPHPLSHLLSLPRNVAASVLFLSHLLPFLLAFKRSFAQINSYGTHVLPNYIFPTENCAINLCHYMQSMLFSTAS